MAASSIPQRYDQEMTPEEFAAGADGTMAPAIERLVVLAFAAVAADNVEALVGWYFDMMREVAIGAVREMLEERRQRPS